MTSSEVRGPVGFVPTVILDELKNLNKITFPPDVRFHIALCTAKCLDQIQNPPFRLEGDELFPNQLPEEVFLFIGGKGHVRMARTHFDFECRKRGIMAKPIKQQIEELKLKNAKKAEEEAKKAEASSQGEKSKKPSK